MNVLLDTRALLALASGSLPSRAASALKTAEEASVSSVAPWEVALKVAALPAIHKDPFDRVLVALAGAKALVILTSDDNITKYPGITTIR